MGNKNRHHFVVVSLQVSNKSKGNIKKMGNKRNTTQYLMPVHKEESNIQGYDIYPSFKTEDGVISTGFSSLAEKISNSKRVTIDGYIGVNFETFRKHLDKALQEIGVAANWTNVEQALLPEHEIDKLITPFMGDEDSIFGTRATINLIDFFNPGHLKQLLPGSSPGINIIYGTGAKLAGWEGLLVYIDLPKNELQFRARAKSARNLGTSETFGMKTTYKRYYFIDWVVLNKHKKTLAGDIDIIIDGQHDEGCVWMEGSTLRKGLKTMGKTFFRVRPWFEPGVWGGNWIKEKIKGVNTEVMNYAWSFELITPENGLIFESGGNLLEVTFDFLMYSEGDAVLGADREKYGDEFPLRFDFLDTFQGGNLSIQCHPFPEYCKMHFGENITQEETYYILDRKNDASVYLGFQDDIDPKEFESALWNSYNTNTELDIEKFVQVHPANKHDLFLIPPGTIHGSGIDNLVLEISTTPYIFTFKLYDWVRPDLDGNPRPLNIEHGMKNLVFDRKGNRVKDELISSPLLINEGPDWRHYMLPTHEKHSYKVQRYHFNSEVDIVTDGKFNVLSLVEGTSISVIHNDRTETFRYAETFVVPAAAKKYTLVNTSDKEAIVVVATMK